MSDPSSPAEGEALRQRRGVQGDGGGGQGGDAVATKTNKEEVVSWGLMKK